jgi:hypothetical protein
MLRNLIRNAIDYTPAGGSVFATSRRCGSELRIEVRLTGLSGRTAWITRATSNNALQHRITFNRSIIRLCRAAPSGCGLRRHTGTPNRDIDALVKGLIEVCRTLTLRRAA